ncbi:MAG: hypothetical protein RL076_1302 [Chloroflexota bacterium]|jgi:hypothetical protein
MQDILDGLAQSVLVGNAGSPFEFLVILLFSVLFGLVYRYIYYIYYKKDEPMDSSVAFSFPLMAPGVTAIFWLIQYSLPLSLGLLGALSFVRFRTPVKRAEDIAFILIVIATSLACAVLKIEIGLMIVVATLMYTIGKNYFFPLWYKAGNTVLLTVHTKDSIDPPAIHAAVMRVCGGNPTLISMSTHDGIHAFVLQIRLVDNTLVPLIHAAIKELDEQARFDIFFQDPRQSGY